MSKKQPLEGLTVRIFDPPSSEDRSKQQPTNRGSRGYREYTEQIGSDKLKYSVHKWNKDDTQAKKPSTNTEGLRKSTKNWDALPEVKVQDLSLVSRLDSDKASISLKNVSLQYELYDHIKEKVAHINDDETVLEDDDRKKKWDPVVDLLRKLREGIYSSHWSDGDYPFAIKVYELSADCSIKAERYEELYKILNGLTNDLYKKKKESKKEYYIALDIIYHCCYHQNLTVALERTLQLSQTTNEGRFGRQLLKAVTMHNTLAYFRLYHHNPYLTFKILMKNHNDFMCKKALQIMRKSYLSSPIAWIGQWIGEHDGNTIIKKMDRLIQPTCIKTIDYDRQTIHFIKNFK